jgi:Flp pilus assembly protein TadD
MNSASQLMSALCCCVLLHAAASMQAKPAAASGTYDYQNGLAAFRRGDLITARSLFDKAVKANPKNAEAQSALGQVLLRQRELPLAIIHFQQLAQLMAQYQLAVALSQKGEKDEAGREFEKASELDSHLVPPR